MLKTKARSQGLKHSATVSAFQDYLTNGSLESFLNLSDNGLVRFHWANWFRTSDHTKAQLQSGNRQHEDILRRLEAARDSEIWIRNRERIVKTSLYELYLYYLDPRVRMVWFARDQEAQVSLHGDAGPFVSLSSLRWLDRDLYGSFIHNKILTTDTVPRRSFRLSTDWPINCRIDNSPLMEFQASLHQFSQAGAVIRVKGRHNIARLERAISLDLTIDLAPFCEIDPEGKAAASKKEKEQLAALSLRMGAGGILERYNNASNARICGGEEFYLFFRYADLIGRENPSDPAWVQEVLARLVGWYQGQFQEELSRIAPAA
jgi:hypothetical protein